MKSGSARALSSLHLVDMFYLTLLSGATEKQNDSTDMLSSVLHRGHGYCGVALIGFRATE